MGADILVSLTWAEFKIFFQGNLEETWIFVNDIWRKIYNINQYQLTDVMDWSANMNHLQFSLKKIQ